MGLEYGEIGDLGPVEGRPDDGANVRPSRTFTQKDAVPNQRYCCVTPDSSHAEIGELDCENFDVRRLVTPDVVSSKLSLSESVSILGELRLNILHPPVFLECLQEIQSCWNRKVWPVSRDAMVHSHVCFDGQQLVIDR
jgi:hypothetical protein